ncbi:MULTISPECIES: iron ABC transporter permease [Rhodomicrobium]|uniref:FecCD family ABC transporter permease n=1 Tax=Rhodomicrobium TaxID=1068 RepID=UPI000B4BD7B1|nr:MULTISPECIES: iron ABC transporter permease [Rhodomicrobium]
MKPLGWVMLLLAVAAALTLGIGVRPVGIAEIWQAFAAPDPNNPAHVTILSIRLPRLWAGIIAGGALGMAGTVMQALTRNPLADPGILGINAGAAFAIVFGSLLLQQADVGLVAVLAFPGAALASLAVFLLGGGRHGDAGPVRLALAGAALNALLLSLVSGVVVLRADSLEVFRFWVVGSLAQAGERPLMAMAAVTLFGAGLALALAPRIEALSLGSALSRGLGTRPGRVQAGGLLAVTALTGAAVSVAGPVAFLGLMVPPISRRITGHELRAELLVSASLGASILLLADTAGRLIFAPAELGAGVMTALIGGPVFVLIARRLLPGGQT